MSGGQSGFEPWPQVLSGYQRGMAKRESQFGKDWKPLAQKLQASDRRMLKKDRGSVYYLFWDGALKIIRTDNSNQQYKLT